MAVVIRKELFNAIQQMCAAANLRLVAVTPRPYAIAAGLDPRVRRRRGPAARVEVRRGRGARLSARPAASSPSPATATSPSPATSPARSSPASRCCWARSAAS